MKNCYRELTPSTSKPNISSRPMLFLKDFTFSSKFIFQSQIFSLSLVTRKKNIFQQRFFANEFCKASASSYLKGELITLTPSFLVLNWKQNWNASYSALVGTAISSLFLESYFLNFRFPIFKTADNILKMHYTSSLEK